MNTNPQNHPKQAIGKVVTSGQGQTSIEKDPSSDGHIQSCTQHQTGDIGDKAVTRTTLLTETRVVEEWVSSCFMNSLCPTIDDRAWTCSHKTLTLLDRKGQEKHEVDHKTWINDISLSHTTHRPWACDSDNNILELVSGQLIQRFRTKEVPECICVTSSDHVLVGMSRHISKYTLQGQVVLTTEATRTEKPLVYTPRKITECPVTNNVAVIDDRSEDHGGDGNRRVIAMDTNFQELFVYRGEIPSSYKQTLRTVDNPFYPRSIVYDSQGNIIIADRNTPMLLLLSGRSEVLRILHTYTESVWLVGIDRHDIVWSEFGNKYPHKVKLLQYSDNT
ncbi:uncharacterized protein [Argopecten irradians]|uniref:uncharacterized protein n=1 Tax=Argopecten irradians TaxID=31199 RepID=UPI003724AFB7